jgi:hypothetical protein
MVARDRRAPEREVTEQRAGEHGDDQQRHPPSEALTVVGDERQPQQRLRELRCDREHQREADPATELPAEHDHEHRRDHCYPRPGASWDAQRSALLVGRSQHGQRDLAYCSQPD